jgi:hypothetical protein
MIDLNFPGFFRDFAKPPASTGQLLSPKAFPNSYSNTAHTTLVRGACKRSIS